MKITLHTKNPHFEANNITEASSKEFADLIRKLEAKSDSEKVEGHFSLYRVSQGSAVLELSIKKK